MFLFFAPVEQIPLRWLLWMLWYSFLHVLQISLEIVRFDSFFFTAALYSSRYPSLSLNALFYESNYLTLFNTQLLHWSCWSSALLGVIQYIANANRLRVWRGGMHDKGSVTAVLSVQIDPPLRDVQRYIHVVYVTDSTFTERIHYSWNSALHFKANVFHIDIVMLYVLADWG